MWRHMWRHMSAMALCAAACACSTRPLAPATTRASVSAVAAPVRRGCAAFARVSPLLPLRGAAPRSSAEQAHGACRAAARPLCGDMRGGLGGPARHAPGRCRMAAVGGPEGERGQVELQRWARAVGIDHGKWGVGAAEGGPRGALATDDIAEGEVPESAPCAASCSGVHAR